MLLAIEGAGKRGRDVVPEMLNEDTLALVKHQLNLSISRLPAEAHANIINKGKQIEELGDEFLNKKITSLSEKMLCEIKEFYTSVSLNEQTRQARKVFHNRDL